MITFKHLRIDNWKQFEAINIEFHPKLTVLTGANGSGKTTILNLLSKHFGWNAVELATPAKNTETGIFSYFTRFFKKKPIIDDTSIGALIYSSGLNSPITVPNNNNDTAQYYLQINNQQPVRGLSISSHRPIFSYRNVPNISTQKRTKYDAFNLVFQSSQNRFFNNNGYQPENYYIKETLLSWAIGGSGNQFIEPDFELSNNFLGYQNTLKSILPSSLGFQEIAIRSYEVVLVTDTGDFMLDGVSGGISALIDISWQIYNFMVHNNENIVVLIDEIENHLHANMQREILPKFIEAFPNVQFIVSTHSPLIIGSVKESNVYAFRYNSQRRIYNQLLDIYNKARTASEILDEVLGVPFTMPIWVENDLNNIVNKYSQLPINDYTLNQMREELRQIGLESLVPLAIQNTLNKQNGQSI
jgi:energy-coupling factor transporter ATP-binding protein EcfA2